jgi:predicted MFS family arabinose efflux permease
MAGGRTLVSSTLALSLPSELRPAATAMRSATMQFGYFTGTLAAGAALSFGGYPALGATMGVLFLVAALVLAGSSPASGCSSGSAFIRCLPGQTEST